MVRRNGAQNNHKNNDEGKVYWNKYRLGPKHNMEV
jgi:hypothetical protein